MPTRASCPLCLPRGGQGELFVAELDPGLGVGVLGMGMRQRHGHVEVVDPGVQRRVEQRHHEARVDGVDEDVAALARSSSSTAPSSEASSWTASKRSPAAWAARWARSREWSATTTCSKTGASGRDPGERRPDPTGPHQQHAHRGASSAASRQYRRRGPPVPRPSTAAVPPAPVSLVRGRPRVRLWAVEDNAVPTRGRGSIDDWRPARAEELRRRASTATPRTGPPRTS